jgi:hypothetical protein
MSPQKVQNVLQPNNDVDKIAKFYTDKFGTSDISPGVFTKFVRECTPTSINQIDMSVSRNLLNFNVDKYSDEYRGISTIIIGRYSNTPEGKFVAAFSDGSMEKGKFKSQLAGLEIVEVFFINPREIKEDGAFAVFAGYGKEFGEIKSEKGNAVSVSGSHVLLGSVLMINDNLSFTGKVKAPIGFSDRNLTQFDIGLVREGWKSKINVNVGFINSDFNRFADRLYLDASFTKRVGKGWRNHEGFTAGVSYEQPVSAPKTQPSVSVNLGISADLFYNWVLKLKGQHTEGF